MLRGKRRSALWSGHHEPRSEEEEEFYVVMGATMYTPALFFAGVELELYLKTMAIARMDLNIEEREWKNKIFIPSHELVKLCTMLGITLTQKERETCRNLSRYIMWMGSTRYPRRRPSTGGDAWRSNGNYGPDIWRREIDSGKQPTNAAMTLGRGCWSTMS